MMYHESFYALYYALINNRHSDIFFVRLEASYDFARKFDCLGYFLLVNDVTAILARVCRETFEKEPTEYFTVFCPPNDTTEADEEKTDPSNSLQKAREYRRRRVSNDNSVTVTPIAGT